MQLFLSFFRLPRGSLRSATVLHGCGSCFVYVPFFDSVFQEELVLLGNLIDNVIGKDIKTTSRTAAISIIAEPGAAKLKKAASMFPSFSAVTASG